MQEHSKLFRLDELCFVKCLAIVLLIVLSLKNLGVFLHKLLHYWLRKQY